MSSLQSIMIEEGVDQEIITEDNPLLEIERGLDPETEGNEPAHLGIDQELLLKESRDNLRCKINLLLENQNKSQQQRGLDLNLIILKKKMRKINSLQAYLQILLLHHLHLLHQTPS